MPEITEQVQSRTHAHNPSLPPPGTFILSINAQWVPPVGKTYARRHPGPLPKAPQGPLTGRGAQLYLLSPNHVPSISYPLQSTHSIHSTTRHFVGKENPAQRGKATCQGHTASQEQSWGSEARLTRGFGVCSPCSEVGGWMLQPHPPFQNHLPGKAVLPASPGLAARTGPVPSCSPETPATQCR